MSRTRAVVSTSIHLQCTDACTSTSLLVSSATCDVRRLVHQKDDVRRPGGIEPLRRQASTGLKPAPKTTQVQSGNAMCCIEGLCSRCNINRHNGGGTHVQGDGHGREPSMNGRKWWSSALVAEVIHLHIRL